MKPLYSDLKYYLWILVCELFLDMFEALLLPGQDCRTLDQGPFYFKRVDLHIYQCVRDGPLYECPAQWSIPDWYVYDDSDPCLCQDVVSEGKRVCPQDPMQGSRTTEDPITATPVIGTINDNGCPSPYQKYEDTLRIYNTSDAKEFLLSESLGFREREDECKYHCLSVGTCFGVTYSVQNGDPVCVGFFTRANSYDFRGSDYHTYFEKVWCLFDSSPIIPMPPPIQNGLLLQNTKQGLQSAYAFLTGVSELSCYSWCYYEESCQAVDYNKVTFECYYFRQTSCEDHEPALDQCCNHYKKKINKC